MIRMLAADKVFCGKLSQDAREDAQKRLLTHENNRWNALLEKFQ